ncbi:MAG: hypothetical protein EU550_01280 [Promethearchaeota archaeon]|nr:MAG: hypothetical protein EU550_01280 [Candidatus Lokiarchaeota archaeon]
MSIDKWLQEEDPESKKKEEKKEKIYKELSEEERKKLKIKSIKKLTSNNKKIKNKKEIEKESFLDYILRFKHWLNQRTYLKGDIPDLETWIKILHKKLQSEIKKAKLEKIESEKLDIIDKFNKIPPRFLDEKTRIAINKKIRDTQRNSSDNYYLRKLKKDIEENLEKAKYYEILKEILNI